MMADRTSASSGLMTSSRSASVLDGAICSSGISSPVDGQPVLDQAVVGQLGQFLDPDAGVRSTSTVAQAQNASVSSRVRSRRFPVSGSSAQVRAERLAARTVRRSVTPAGGEQLAGCGGGAGLQARGGFLPVPGDSGTKRGQHGQPFASALVHACLAACGSLAVLDVGGPDRAGHRPRPPLGRVFFRPLRQVEVEGPHPGQDIACRVPLCGGLAARPGRP